jgi:hypothetical protein
MKSTCAATVKASVSMAYAIPEDARVQPAAQMSGFGQLLPPPSRLILAKPAIFDESKTLPQQPRLAGRYKRAQHLGVGKACLGSRSPRRRHLVLCQSSPNALIRVLCANCGLLRVEAYPGPRVFSVVKLRTRRVPRPIVV